MSLHKTALLILLAACARPAYSGSASAGEATPAPASSLAPAAMPSTAPPLADATVPATAAIRPSARQSISRSRGLAGANRRAAAPVLVIPAKEMTPETCDRIVEDLSIMSRIIEKSLRDASEQGYGLTVTASGMYGGGGGSYGRGAGIYGQTLFLPSDSTGPRVLRSSGGRPKAIYIGGYGAVFSLQVDFPLVPPPETPEPNKTTDKADRVWAAAQRELVNPQAALHLRPGVSQGMPYRPEAVENLRSALIAVLQHASNIRDLEPESWLTIVVQGCSTVADQPEDSSGDQQGNLIGVRPSGSGRTLLTLRARKADIDQLAKGPLEQTEFQKRVQITSY
ncbi:MAG: hypothetical protein NTZ17_15470 [Phycisphaerae bacterium]|nr:hypothetical protein [Phycisphaerae bacterium]